MASPDGWVWRTATNHVRRTARRRSREIAVLAADPRVLSAREGEVAPDLDLQSAILGLSPRQRTAVVLRYLADLPTGEIAGVMQVADGTVHATLHQARARLAEALGQPIVVADDAGRRVAGSDRPVHPNPGGGRP
jgi:RNA polymerase sigma-70 factor (ECF subfamily)